MSDVVRVAMLGQTGGGKSRTAQAWLEHLGQRGVVFEDSDGDTSHTRAPLSFVIDGLKITDNPGLMDTGGRAMDIANMTLIVNTAKADPSLNAAILVLNESNDRFDSAVQECMQLFANSLGPEILSHTAIVFTRAGEKTPEQALQRATRIASVLRELTGIPITSFPVFQLDTRVESDARFHPAYVSDRKEKNARAFDALTMWVRTQSAIPATDFKIGEYAETKRLREEQERTAAEKKRADDEAAARCVAEQRAREAQAALAAAHRDKKPSNEIAKGISHIKRGFRF